MFRPLTVIVPCKNEQDNIGACIESFLDLADEILIADSGSTDRTIEISRQYPKTRIIQREYITSGDFKNWACPQAKNEWILVVDADERVTKELAEEIRLVLDRGPTADGYWIYRDNHFMGHRLYWGDARTDAVLRLFRRDIGYCEGPGDHAQTIIPTNKVETLRAKFLHYSVWNYDQILMKYHRYTTLQAEQWYEQGIKPSYFKLLVRPAFRFFREYILQLGILDGKAGLQLAWMAAFYSFMKQARLWELYHSLPQPLPKEFDESETTDQHAASMQRRVTRQVA
ncbi:MAG TPA: glycosyltransferase family 2 protein [Pirellulaceae bacterium]|nr:glycosyltransferase family 2 protein [Pirellulaceae bacterium]HMO90645.1 glycosyltransferase family 2 protein [Pirellulaceae bacterium]HMP67776.1 glycosyltransferase family 2 protein [Pirellulaceae bacterium]